MNTEPAFWLPLLMLVLGVLTHWLKQISMARRVGGSPISLRAYWLENWPETLVAVTSAAAGFLFLMESGNLSAVNAFGIGYIANSIADVLGSRVQALVGSSPQIPPTNGAGK